MKIALDVMGGDYAPAEIIAGAHQALAELGPVLELILVGPREQIESQWRACGASPLPELVETSEFIQFRENPSQALRGKPRASIRLICELVRDGRAAAALTMGHTGAGLIAALTILGRLPGVHRPAIAVPYFGLHPDTLLIDAGANVDCKPEYLAQFGVMGSIYVERVLGIPNPTVALLTNGREDNKGSDLTRAALQLLRSSGVNVIGNVEGYDLPLGTANVIVSDGLWGNIALKVSEGLSEALLAHLEALLTTPDACAVLAAARRMMDYAEIGAVPLLGVEGLCLIGHGRSRAPAVVGGLKSALRAVESGLLAALRRGLAQDR